MTQKIDSDNDFSMRGKVLSLARGRPDNSHDKDLVTLVLSDEIEGTQHIVDLPIRTESEFELLPYQVSFVGNYINYFKTFKHWQEGTAVEWIVKILSGPLKDQTYKHEYKHDERA